MAEVKRVCGYCGVDQTSLGGNLNEIRDFRGNSFGLLGSACECHTEVRRMLDKLCNMHGGYVDENGNVLASPQGTPSLHSFGDLRKAVKEA